MNALGDAFVSGLDCEEVLPSDLSEAFRSRAKSIQAKAGQLLIAQGSVADDVFLIISGKLQISIFSANGRETILRDMSAGRLVGEMSAISGENRSASVTAMENSELAVMSGSAFRAFMHEVGGMGYWMSVQLAARVRNLTEKATELATLPISARLQSELLRLAADQGFTDDRCHILLLPTHAELASRIGTHREAVTRELRLLAKDGVATQSGRTLVISSVSKLRMMLERLMR